MSAGINRELAKMFGQMAAMLEIEEVEWKPRAYRDAARGVRGLKRSVEDIYDDDGKKGLKDISGVGDSIADHIIEYIEKGKIKKFDRLRKKYPEKFTELMELEGIGPKKLKKLYKELDIDSETDLKKAARKHKIQELEGFGEKTEEDIIDALKAHKKGKGRMLLNQALPLAEEIVGYLKEETDIEKIDYVGSLRRMKETIGDIDILVVSKDNKKVMDAFTGMDGVKRVVSRGSTRSSVVLEEDSIHVDLRVIPKPGYAAALMYFTGSKPHNIAVRKIAIKKGYKLSEYGLFRKKSGNKISMTSEKSLYKKLGMQYVPPELREDRDEIDAAKKKALPSLVELDDIRGDLQMHTTYSDGNAGIRDMAKKASDLGYDYVAITDHSRSSRVAKGMDVKRLKKQWSEISKAARGRKLKIFRGAEVDILKDGKLDYPDKVLKESDIIVASVHSNFRQSKKKMTDRIVGALENDYVDILSHPTGRIIGRRKPIGFDEDKVFQAAEDNDVVLEINAHPERLDLNDEMILKANEFGVKFSIDTDSHSVSNLDFMKFGVGQARRGWLEKKDVVNTYTYNRLKKVFTRLG